MTEDKKEYIEVLGEASYIEKPVKYPVELEVRITASNEEKSGFLERFSKIEEIVLNWLKTFEDDVLRISDAGRRLNSYHDRRKAEIIASRKFLVEFGSLEKLEKLWRGVMEFNSTEKETISLEPMQPYFSAESSHEQDAHNKALLNARDRVKGLASASSKKIGSLISSKQLALKERWSGAYSDEDWWGDAERFRRSYHIGGVASVELEEPERVVYVRYLVRYEVTDA